MIREGERGGEEKGKRERGGGGGTPMGAKGNPKAGPPLPGEPAARTHPPKAPPREWLHGIRPHGCAGGPS